MSEDTPTARDVPARDLAEDRATAGARPSAGGFADRYATGDELGRGGMGRVVEATDTMLDRTVALKQALDTDEEALRRFAREVKITARLEHPSIVPVYDAGVSPTGEPFYVMRKVTGRPLDKLVGDAADLDARLALLPHVVAACQAVAHAHERGIVHRDLKPSNILVGARGETVVIDWGLAKATGETDEASTERDVLASDSLRTRAGTVFGTPGFMSPEQLATTDVDERADVYALGATLFYLLADRAPHPGKTADEVEAHARRGPPPPVASVVPGVSRELSTIVDKALAYDLAVRYANAGALAEDLSRFMAGQLVAAHDYSPRERIVRFVRQNRALVATIAGALVVLAIGSWIAVGRVIAARDEAVAQAAVAEAARTREAERASDLVISQARLLLATNPSAAVALVRPLAGTARWREVRAIVAGARASGVAWRLPGPSDVKTADMSFGGTHALVVGADGAIHVYDLAARTHDVIATIPNARATFADETHVAAWVDKTFTIIDLATRATKTYDQQQSIEYVDAREGLIYYVDRTHHAWRFDATTGETLAIPVDGRVDRVAASPDGKWFALGGANLWVAETKTPTLVDMVHAGTTFDLAWSATEQTVAAIAPSAIYTVHLHPEVTVDELVATNEAIAVARGTVYSSGPSGWTVGQTVAERADVSSALLGIHVTDGDFVVGADHEALRIFDGTHEYRMPLPVTPISYLRASPRGPYIFAICGGELLVFDIDDIMPHRITVPGFSQVIAVGPDQVWTIPGSSSITPIAIDVHTKKTHDLPPLTTMWHSAPPSGAYVIAREIATDDTILIHPDGMRDKVPVAGMIPVALDDQRAVVATKQNELVLYEIATKTTRQLAAFPAKIERLAVHAKNPRWIVALIANGTLWRIDLASGKTTETTVPPHVAPHLMAANTAATADGDVFFAIGSRLRRWRADGSIEDFVTLPREIQTANLVDDTHVIVLLDGFTAHLVDVRHPGELAKLPSLGSTYVWLETAPFVVADAQSHGVVLIDVEANAWWTIAHATPSGMTPILSGDASVVVMRDAADDAQAIALWNLDLPATPEDTARWVDRLTNATFDPKTGILGWR